MSLSPKRLRVIDPKAVTPEAIYSPVRYVVHSDFGSRVSCNRQVVGLSELPRVAVRIRFEPNRLLFEGLRKQETLI